MSNSGLRRQVEELKTRYELEPSLPVEIYVEGSLDKSIIEWFLKKEKIDEIYVYEIETIEISKKILDSLTLDDENNRTRLIALANIIPDRIACIIDSDFDFLDNPSYQSTTSLFKTDFACLEMYYFNPEIIEKLFLGFPPSNTPSCYINFIENLGEILKKIALIRFAKSKVAKSLPHKEIVKDLIKENSTIKFDQDNYLKKYVNYQKELLAKFSDFIAKTTPQIPQDCRLIIQGHDFIELLQFYCDVKQRDAKEIFQNLFYSCIDIETLKNEKMFINLVQYLKK